MSIKLGRRRQEVRAESNMPTNKPTKHHQVSPQNHLHRYMLCSLSTFGSSQDAGTTRHPPHKPCVRILGCNVKGKQKTWSIVKVQHRARLDQLTLESKQQGRQMSIYSREVSNSNIGGQGTLATVFIGVSKKQLQPSNCPGQYSPVKVGEILSQILNFQVSSLTRTWLISRCGAFQQLLAFHPSLVEQLFVGINGDGDGGRDGWCWRCRWWKQHFQCENWFSRLVKGQNWINTLADDDCEGERKCNGIQREIFTSFMRREGKQSNMTVTLSGCEKERAKTNFPSFESLIPHHVVLRIQFKLFRCDFRTSELVYR